MELQSYIKCHANALDMHSVAGVTGCAEPVWQLFSMTHLGQLSMKSFKLINDVPPFIFRGQVLVTAEVLQAPQEMSLKSVGWFISVKYALLLLLRSIQQCSCAAHVLNSEGTCRQRLGQLQAIRNEPLAGVGLIVCNQACSDPCSHCCNM